jgi:RNA polymerase sigma factor (sigma-70 family)
VGVGSAPEGHFTVMTLALRVPPRSADCDEQELVALARGGDDRGFEELYGRYRRRIAAYVLGMVGDHGRAEDITQEVFISALRRMRETERPIAFKPWIHEIAKNACIDHARRTRRVHEISLSAEPEPPPNSEVALRGPTLESTVEARQQLTDLRGAFGCLSENHHRMLVMRELEGRSYEHIAEQLGMSRGMVESTLFRARRKLGEEYEELVTGSRCEFVQTLVVEREPRSLGIRETRRVARHLSHCQPCRRHAHLAGFDESQLKPKSIRERIAGLLPFPILPLRGLWRGGGRARRAANGSWLHSRMAWRSVNVLSRFAGPDAGSLSLGRAAAAAVAVLALTGAGGGLIAAAHGAPKARGAGSSHAAGGLTPASTATGRRPGPIVPRGGQSSQTPRKLAGSTGAPPSGGATPGGTRPTGATPTSSTPTGGAAGSTPSAQPSHHGVPALPLPNVLPALPKVTLPKVALPKVGLPPVSLPKVALRPVSLPPVALPKVSLPPVNLPSVSLPTVAVPKVRLPAVKVP